MSLRKFSPGFLVGVRAVRSGKGGEVILPGCSRSWSSGFACECLGGGLGFTVRFCVACHGCCLFALWVESCEKMVGV